LSCRRNYGSLIYLYQKEKDGHVQKISKEDKSIHYPFAFFELAGKSHLRKRIAGASKESIPKPVSPKETSMTVIPAARST
jgi:hypothetical protein